MANDDHGQTPAAWTTVAVIILGSIVVAFGVVFTSYLLCGIGAAVIVIGAAVGKVMAMMGLGAPPGYHDH